MSNPINTQVIQVAQVTAGSVPTPPAGSSAMYVDLATHLLAMKNSSGTSTNVGGGGGSGTVLSVTAGTGLSGGSITTTGTISLAATSVTAGTYTRATITVDAQGRITNAVTTADGGGTVTSVTAGSGLSGGTITATGTVSITDTAVTPGTYTLATITVNSKGQITSAANGSGGAGTVSSIAAGVGVTFSTITSTGTIRRDPNLYDYSLVDRGVSLGGTSAASDTTVGNSIIFKKTCTVTGIRFFWYGGSSGTIKLTIWDGSNASAGTVNVAATSAGAYTGTFGAAVAITAGNLYVPWTIGMYNTSASIYSYVNSAPGRPGSLTDNIAYSKNPWIGIICDGVYHAGNARPDTQLGGTGQYFALEPVLTDP